MTRRTIRQKRRPAEKSLIALVAGLLLALPAFDLPAVDFSRMHGAGLVDKQAPGYYPPSRFREADFAFLRDHELNFARLPISYQFWTRDEAPDSFDEDKMREIDQAVAWGEQYSVHICLSFYAVPGYAITDPDQQPSLWTDEKMQERFVTYWQEFARRYRHIPPERLSFNLINEPAWNLSEEKYAPVMRRAIDAIRAIDPARPIVVDGLKAGRLPVLSLADTGVVQAAHFYEPFAFTHYAAPWLTDGSRLPRPETWPAPRLTQHLFGPEESGHSPLRITGTFDEVTRLRLRIGLVAVRSDTPLVVSILADGHEIGGKHYEPTTKSAQTEEPPEQWLDEDLFADIPAGTQTVEIVVRAGYRLTFREIGLQSAGREALIRPLGTEWTSQAATLSYRPATGIQADLSYDKAWIREEMLRTWQPFLAQGGRVMVQEFGCYNQTPDEATRNYLRDCIEVWNEAGWGWALWSLRGPMGLIDNGRTASDLLPHKGTH